MTPSGRPAPAAVLAALAPVALAPAPAAPAALAAVPELAPAPAAPAPAAPAHQHRAWHLKHGKKLRRKDSQNISKQSL